MPLAAVTLDDKYAVERGRVYLTGTQALVRLPMMQRRRDAAAGLNTAGFIAGYRGSPLGGLDQQLWRARAFLEKHAIHFKPAVNEDLGATAMWGTQQVGLFPGATVDGVFGMWYGKGPGVDRSGDALKHANSAGTAPLGGVLALAGDDHTCKSSTLAHQSEYAFMDASIPVLNPAGVQDFLDLGLHGWAMSRFSGLWVAFKTVAETVDTSASVEVDPHRIQIVAPTDFAMPPGGLAIRLPDTPLDQEYRLHRYKLAAALAYARANRLDRVVLDSPRPRLGIATAGKSYLDVRQALDDLGIDDALAAEIGLRVYKVAMTWPLEPEGARAFAKGLEEVLVVEEKRAVIETQLKEQLYDWTDRPRVMGKFDPAGEWVLPSAGELTPTRIALVIGARIARFHDSARLSERLAALAAAERAAAPPPPLSRIPYFCSGCPHNTSTKVPEGSRALAGIGCHYLVQWMNRETRTYTQMGGEGASWIGQAPFTRTPHVFVNIGDGTYFHSGLLAIRAAVSAKVNVTYKVLFNDAVAMTGGQPMDGPLTVPAITYQLYGEGVARIAVVADDPDRYPVGTVFAPDVAVYHRDRLDEVQRALREIPGTTVIVYDQVCATEKRRRRKRGLMEDPPRRVVINEGVCEGCGDCSQASNCLSVTPLETEFGRKRAIDQSSCNKDFSCLKGFCPSFVTVEGGRLRRPERAGLPEPATGDLPTPALPALDEPYGILVTGVGGTGVVTIGAILGAAAHMEGKGISVLDQVGLAQKYGAVSTHVRIAARPNDIHATRIATGAARLLLGCDLVVSAASEPLSRLSAGATRAVVNIDLSPTADFALNPDAVFPAAALERRVADAVGADGATFLAATHEATALMGDAIATNLYMVGIAWQQGLIPLSAEAIEAAIRLNGVAVEASLRAFRWGRRRAAEPSAVTLAAKRVDREPPAEIATDLAAVIAKRAADLTAYQDAAYAARYTTLVERVRAAEAAAAPGQTALTESVARAYHRLLAYKDEYEVARLFTDGRFLTKLRTQFEGDYRLRFHLAPPLLAPRDPATGQLQKRAFGPWMMRAFALLAPLRRLRGTPLDIFGYSAERRAERALIANFEATVATLLATLDAERHARAVEIARLPLEVRGFGHVKERSIKEYRARQAALLAAYAAPAAARAAAE